MPFITVIITAFNRKKYILDAVTSVLNQTIPRDTYEVIIVKNFRDPDIDKFLEENGVVQVFEPSKYWNVSLSRAMEISRGHVVSFLDDDDYYDSRKLETVTRLFNEEAIVFCKDGTTAVDEKGDPIDTYRDRSQEKAYFYLDWDGTYSGNRSYLSLFNSSSMSILKEPFFSALSNLNEKLRSGDGCRFAMDNFICFVGLEAGRCLVIPDKITFYRHHENQLTVNGDNQGNFVQNKVELEMWYRNSYHLMRDAFSSREVLKRIDDMEMQSLLQTSILTFKRSNFSGHLVGKAIKILLSSSEKYVLLLIFLYILANVSSSLSSSLLKFVTLKMARKLN